MSDSIKVSIKVRPLIKREIDDNLPIQWDVKKNAIVAIDRPDHQYYFDHVFDIKSTNYDIYDTCVRSIVESVVNGFNGTVFAYGQTSSGKTHTMLGSPNELGIIPLAVENIFDAIINKTGREFLIRVCYLEIYNEKVNDLLHEDADLKIHEDANGLVMVKCKEEMVRCPENVYALMKKGDKNRRIGETNMNERSSRSHTIFRITMESREAGSGSDGAVNVSQLNLVDLAGSERTKQTGATGERFIEGKHINMSLSTLGLVIKQLSESQEGSKFVNFRDSKLTRILQASLGGNALTTIICAVTPASFEETQCTLAFASRAKCIKNKPKLNEVMSDATLLKRYSKQLAKLTADLEKAKQTSQSAKVEEMESRLQEKDRMNQLLEDRIRLLKTQIVSGPLTLDVNDHKSKARRRQTWGGPSMPGNSRRSLALPTITELETPETTSRETMKSAAKKRQSIMQIPDIAKENFQTEIADFEMELIESERNWETHRFSTDSQDGADYACFVTRRRGRNRVQFQDDVTHFPPTIEESFTTLQEECESPSPSRSETISEPGTPKAVLRGKITDLTDEIINLQDFTTLEKQLIADDKVRWEHVRELEQTLRETNKSLEDSQMMCLETNKKYSELKDQYSELETKYNDTLVKTEALEQRVESVASLEERLKETERESQAMKKVIAEKQKRIQVLEEEGNDFEFRLELLEKKHKTREKELELSLQNAWSEDAFIGKSKPEDIANLQLLVDNLTKELLTFKQQTMDCSMSECESTVENEVSQRDLNSSRSPSKMSPDRSNAKEMSRLKKIIKENTAKIKSHEDMVTAFKSDIDRLQREVETKTKENFEIRSKLEETERLVARVEVPEDSKALDQDRPSVITETLAKAEVSSKEENTKEAEENTKEVEENTKEVEENTKEAEETDQKKDVDGAERESRIRELEKEVEKLKDQLLTLHEKTTYDVDKCAAQIVGTEHEAAMQRISKLEIQVEDAKFLNGEFERTITALRQEVNEKTLELETITAHAYDREIENLKSYVTELQEFNKSLKEENERLKTGLREQSVAQLQNHSRSDRALTPTSTPKRGHRASLANGVTKKHSDTENSEDSLETEKNSERDERTEIEDTIRNEKDETLEKSVNRDEERNNTSNGKMEERVVSKKPGNGKELGFDEESGEGRENSRDHSTIFANATYFDQMNVSDVGNATLYESIGNVSSVDDHNESTVSRNGRDEAEESTVLKASCLPLEDSNASLAQTPTNILMNGDVDKLHELNAAKILLEEENAKVKGELELTMQKYYDITNDLQELRSGMENLKQTIGLLTDENIDMSTKWAAEKERAKQAETEFQAQVDDLYSRIAKINEEKVSVESELRDCQELLEAAKSNSYVATDNEALEKIQMYREKIDSLTEENISLSSDLMEKLEELDKIKESKALHYEHDCLHKDRAEQLTQELDALRSENNELSSDLMERIEELDALNNKYAILHQKLEATVAERRVSITGSQANELDEVTADNDKLRSENIELAAKVSSLMEENDQLSENLLQNIPEVSNAQPTDSDNQLTSDAQIGDDLRQQLTNSRQEVEQLKRLNEKLSDLKLNTCEQCAHLKELNHSRRSLKLEVKTLNHKIKDLQIKFDRKCADTEVLRHKACEELNLSALSESVFDVSAPETLNVTLTEEKLRSLASDFDFIKQSHDELMDRFGCSSEAGSLEKTLDPKSPSPSGSRSRERIERIQVDIDKLRGELQQLKKHNSGLGDSVQKFIGEKARLQAEIEALKIARDESIAKAEAAEMEVSVVREKVGMSESDVAGLNEQISTLRATEGRVIREKLDLETQIDVLRTEIDDQRKIVKEYEENISSEKKSHAETMERLEVLVRERDHLRDKLSLYENDVVGLNEQIAALRCLENQANQEKLNYETEINALRLERSNDHREAMNQLERTLAAEQESNASALEKIRQLELEKGDLTKQCETVRGDLAILNEQMEALRSLERQANRDKESLEFEVDSLKSKCEDLCETVDEKETALTAEKETMASMVEKLKIVERQRDSMREKLDDAIAKESVDVDCNDAGQEFKKELDDARRCIGKEMKSLKSSAQLSELSDMSVSELFREFLTTIMNKEQEIIKTIREQYETEKQMCEDAKRQSDKAQKQAMNWAKELEMDIERLQSDASALEKSNAKLRGDINRLENELKESNHEKQSLKEKMGLLETDFNGLQTELEKRSEAGDKQGEAASVAQERERQALIAARNRETELQNSIKAEKDRLNKRIEELNSIVEDFRGENTELRCNVEGLEAQESQLKNIIDVKSSEISKLQHRLGIVESEHKQLTETCAQLGAQLDDKSRYVEEVKSLLKTKCDKVTEYKGKLEAILPENELLKEQLAERREYADKYKSEFEKVREESEKRLNTVQDELDEQSLKVASLSEQLSEANVKIRTVIAELDDAKSKCEELEVANQKLTRKVRNSTSNAQVEVQIEDLKDQNATLRKNAEGASNRISELLENRTSLTRELLSLQGKYDALLEEKSQLAKVIEASNSSDVVALRNKLDAEVQQKNQIALELEDKRLAVMRKDKDLVNAANEIEKLKVENQELNEEMDGMVKDFHERDAEINRLQNIILESGGKLVDTPSTNDSPKNCSIVSRKPVDSPRVRNSAYRRSSIVPSAPSAEVTTLVQQNRELRERFEKATSEVDSLTRDNSELRVKISELEHKLGSQSRGSSRSASPTGNNRRKQRRSDLFNQNRLLDNIDDTRLDDVDSNSECRCQALAEKVRELELDIVTRNGQLATLQIQIQSENFPYQKKCKDLEENLLAFKNKNQVLKEEVKRLQRAMVSTSMTECEICRKRSTNRRDQSSQTLPERKTFLSGTSSGIVDEFSRIAKLEKDHGLMRLLCRNRSQTIKQLQERIAELEEERSSQPNYKSPNKGHSNIKTYQSDTSLESVKSLDRNGPIDNTKLTYHETPQAIGQKSKRPMKENTSANILDKPSVGVSSYGRILRNRYP